jgi:hypothetical protein
MYCYKTSEEVKTYTQGCGASKEEEEEEDIYR